MLLIRTSFRHDLSRNPGFVFFLFTESFSLIFSIWFIRRVHAPLPSGSLRSCKFDPIKFVAFMATYSFLFRTSMCSTLRAANAFKSDPIRFVYSKKRVGRKMPPHIAHPRKCAEGSFVTHAVFGRCGTHSQKTFAQTSSRKTSEQPIRSSVSSNGVEVKNKKNKTQNQA